MRCRGCEYPLWNIAPGPCPECGRPFRPSERAFAPASVAFCCPACDQAYFGTSTKGHLVPDRFDCVGCGQALEMDSMVVRPASDRPEAQQVVDVPPCLRRDHGRFRRWFMTLFWALGMPGRLISGIPVDRSLPVALGFFLPLLLVVVVGGALPILLFVNGFVFNGLGAIGQSPGNLMVAIGWSVLSLLGYGVGLLLLVLLWALVAHLVLAVFGLARHGLPRTVAAMMFASAPFVMVAVPCLGIYAGGLVLPFWCFVLGVLSLRSAQEVGTGAAIGANAAFALLLGAALFAWIWVLVRVF